MKNKNVIGISSVTLVIATIFMLMSTGVAMATVWTDQQDYSPGSVVTISGDNSDNAGYSNSETVNVHVDGPSNYDSSCSGTADSSGAWSCQIKLVSDLSAEGQYNYTASGQTSGVKQSGTFYDSGSMSYSPSSQSLTVNTGGTGSFTQTVTAPKNNGVFTASLHVAGTGTNPIAGTWVSTSPTSLSFSTTPSAGDTKSWTVILTVPSGTTAGTYTANIKANPSITGVGEASGTAVTLTVVADTTPPIITPTISGTKGTNDWYTSDVIVTWSVTDPESGISSSTGCGSTTLTSETTGTSLTCSATDGAGLSSSNSVTIKIDKTAPTVVSLSVTTGTLGTNGWYTSDVIVHTSGSDDISGPPTCTADQSQITDTTGTVFNGKCANDAGLSTDAAPLTVKFDKTGPSAILAITAGTLGSNGWYTSDVTISTMGSDSISSPVTCTADQSQITETTGTTFNGACTNDAGLSTNAVPITVKLDKTGPSANLAVTAGTPGTNGWYISDVTVSMIGSDSISSPVSCTADQYLTGETTGAIFNGKCTNDAGLSTYAESLTVKLDKTGPTAALSVTTGTLGDNGWYVSDVIIHTAGSDTISSPVTCTAEQFQTTDTIGVAFNGQCTNDAGLSTDTISLTVKLDKTKPVITINSPIATDYILNQNVLADWTATDATSGIFSKTGTVVSGSAIDTGSVGQKTFSVTVTDNAGNFDTKSVIYNVIYNFAGFFQPVDNSPAWNVVKAGSAIPVKFSLTGYQGLDIMSQGYPTSNKVDYNGGSLDDVDQTVTAGSSSLTYDVTIGQYIYVWKTDKAWAGTYRQLVVKLKDGTLHLANFKFK